MPAGGALAVDRDGFSAAVTQALATHPLIEIRREEIDGLPPRDWGRAIIATGPLTSPALAEAIRETTGEDSLSFFDAIAPIVHRDSINTEIAWFQSRYDKKGPGGDGADYLNCPLDEAQYRAGRAFQDDWEKAERGARAVDPTREFIDGGSAREPITGRQRRVVLRLNRIERETQRLNELIGGLLNLARLESGTEKLDQERVDLQALVLAVAEDANFEANSRNRTVRVLTVFPCRRKGNLQLLRSAVENVVRNAANYTPEGAEVEVSLLPADRGYSALIHIRDHGSGVPEAALKTIFEPFFRVDEARDRLSGGAGLGLSITDRVIRAHGGAVRAHNHADGGLVIELTLPLS